MRAWPQAQQQVSDLTQSTKTYQLNLDKLTRVQHEMLQRSRKSDDAMRVLQGEKEAAKKSLTTATSKLAVQERQLKTFLEANEALESDLRKQLQLLAALDRRKQEQESEKQTIEAYYEARIDEMQTQYDRLLADIDQVKQAAKEEVFKTFDDHMPVVPLKPEEAAAKPADAPTVKEAEAEAPSSKDAEAPASTDAEAPASKDADVPEAAAAASEAE